MILRLLLHHLAKHKASILVFLGVGTFSAVVNLLSFGFFWHYAHLNYQVSVSIAYVLSVLVHFILNRYVTFGDYSTTFLPQIQRYLIMLATNYLITLLIVQLVVELLHFSPYAGIIGAIGCTVSISYFMSRFWIFNSSKQV